MSVTAEDWIKHGDGAVEAILLERRLGIMLCDIFEKENTGPDVATGALIGVVAGILAVTTAGSQERRRGLTGACQTLLAQLVENYATQATEPAGEQKPS